MGVWMKWSPQISHIYMKTIRAARREGNKKSCFSTWNGRRAAVHVEAERVLLVFVVDDVFRLSGDNNHTSLFNTVSVLLLYF